MEQAPKTDELSYLTGICLYEQGDTSAKKRFVGLEIP